jgi:hypothetical protein
VKTLFASSTSTSRRGATLGSIKFNYWEEIVKMDWLEKRLVLLIATFYATVMARAIAALPHDDLETV